MSGDYCRGCGVVIQSVDPNKPGFVPENITNKNKSLICQRCYRMTHYGKVATVQPGTDKIKQSIGKAITLSDLLVIVADFSDIAGTLPVWSGFLGGKPYILVVNKSDLIPIRTKQPEIVEYLKKYLQADSWETARDIIMVSGLKGKGIEILAGRIAKETTTGGKIAILGVTNVGKSSLVKRLLFLEKSPNAPTISKYPGTTMGLSNWSILKGRNTLIDTPGLVSGERMGDLFCPECSSRLLSPVKIGQKLWNLEPGKGFIVGGLFGIENLGDMETVIIAFASPEMMLHRTDNSKIESLLNEGPAWLNKLCEGCKRKIAWEEQTIKLKNNHDLAIAGLGWVSLRGQDSAFRIRIPTGVRWEIREALVGKK